MGSSYREAMMNRVKERQVEQSKKGGGAGGEYWWLRLKDGESVKVRPLHSPDMAPLIDTHDTRDKSGNGDTFLCMAQFDMDCPLCGTGGKAGNRKPNLHLFMYRYDLEGKTYDKDGEKIPENPVQIFQRTPGKNFVNHFELFELHEAYSKDQEIEDPETEQVKKVKGTGFQGRDWTIKRSGSQMDTTYSFTPDNQRKFKMPSKPHEKLTKLLEIVEKKDIAELFLICLRKYALPEGVADYPTKEQVQASIDAMISGDDTASED